jgi:hypothetical protein
MITATFVHPSDYRQDGRPLTIVLRKPGRVESMKREAALEEQKLPYEVRGAAGKPATADNGARIVEWKRPQASTGKFDYREWLEWVLVEAKNTPEGGTISKGDVWDLFDERWDVEIDEVVDEVPPSKEAPASPSTSTSSGVSRSRSQTLLGAVP